MIGNLRLRIVDKLIEAGMRILPNNDNDKLLITYIKDYFDYILNYKKK